METGEGRNTVLQYEDDDDDEDFGFKQQQAQHRQFLDNEVKKSNWLLFTVMLLIYILFQLSPRFEDSLLK